MITLLHWALDISPKMVTGFLDEKSEIKEITKGEEIYPLLYRFNVKNIVLGLSTLESYKNSWLPFLKKIPLHHRREIFVLLISPEVKTYDPIETFLLEANLCLNSKDLPNFRIYFERAKNYFEELYYPYRRAIEKLERELP